MKKHFVLLAFVISNLIYSQKGSFLVSGNFGYSSDKESFTGYYFKANQFKISSKTGYQISKDFTLGIELAYGNVKVKEDDLAHKIRYEANIYNFGGFIRYSKSLVGIFSFFTDLSGGKVIETRHNAVSDTPYPYIEKKRGYFLILNPSILIEVKNKFGLTFSMGGVKYVAEKLVDANYDNQPSDTKNYKASNLEFTFGKAFEVGFQKNF